MWPVSSGGKNLESELDPRLSSMTDAVQGEALHGSAEVTGKPSSKVESLARPLIGFLSAGLLIPSPTVLFINLC